MHVSSSSYEPNICGLVRACQQVHHARAEATKGLALRHHPPLEHLLTEVGGRMLQSVKRDLV